MWMRGPVLRSGGGRIVIMGWRWRGCWVGIRKNVSAETYWGLVVPEELQFASKPMKKFENQVQLQEAIYVARKVVYKYFRIF